MIRLCLLLFFWGYYIFQVQTFSQTTPKPSSNPDPLEDSIYKYYNVRLYLKALPFAAQLVEQVKKEKGETSLDYGTALCIWGDVLNRSAKRKEAKLILLQGLDIQKKELGQNHPDVAKTLSNLGFLYGFLADYKNADLVLNEALVIKQSGPFENRKGIGHIYKQFGVNQSRQRNFIKAEEYLFLALDETKKEYDPGHPEVAIILKDLGDLSYDKGDFQKSEEYYKQSLTIQEKKLPAVHIDNSKLFSSFGRLFHTLGNLEKADQYYRKSLVLDEQLLPPNHPDIAGKTMNIGLINYDRKNFKDAERFYLKGQSIMKKTQGDTTYNIANSYVLLANVNRRMFRYYQTEQYLTKAYKTYSILAGPNAYSTARFCDVNFASLYVDKGEFAKANYHLELAHKNMARSVGLDHPTLSNNYDGLAMAQFGLKNFPLTAKHLKDSKSSYLFQIQRYFPFLSDEEKEKFYSRIQHFFETYNGISLELMKTKPELSAEMFNLQLATKGLLLQSSAKWKHRIRTSGDKRLIALFGNWETYQEKLSKLYQSTDSSKRAGIDSIEVKTQRMEKELSLLSENFAKLADQNLADWKEVQKKLKKGEAAVEIIRMEKYGIQAIATDTSHPKMLRYRVPGLTDTIYYAALIVKPVSVYPEMVLLKNGNEMEGRHFRYYQNSISKKLPDEQSYGKFWEKIGARLGGSKRVYFSPDGVFQHINLNTLFNPKTKKYLLEEKDIRMVTATKDLLQNDRFENPNYQASLVGFPSYYASNATTSVSTEYRSSPNLTYRLAFSSDQTIADLPATKVEVDKITGILQAKNWTVTELTGEKALEEKIKETISPKVLHIATHGFFQPDSTEGSNPLLRSGLMLTGAGATLKGEGTEKGEDGILTAYEAMNLNLDNTDLVVLSACETGLGEIKNGEGVYGLQRAFMVAGVRSLIMSLWKVNDEATQELMVAFYRNWLDGTSKRAAFLKAQKELKVKYPNPYYWGAFVLVGE